MIDKKCHQKLCDYFITVGPEKDFISNNANQK